MWVKPGITPQKEDMTPGSEDFGKTISFYADVIAALAPEGKAETYSIRNMANDILGHMQEKMPSFEICGNSH